MDSKTANNKRAGSDGESVSEAQQGLGRRELEEQQSGPPPSRQVMSLITPNPSAAVGMEMAHDVPAADPAPVGGRVTILEGEPL